MLRTTPHQIDHELDRVVVGEPLRSNERPPRVELERVAESGEKAGAAPPARAPSAGADVAGDDEQPKLLEGDVRHRGHELEVAQAVEDELLVACVVGVELPQRRPQALLAVADLGEGGGIGRRVELESETRAGAERCAPRSRTVAFGLGVAFVAFGRPRVRRAIGGSRGRTVAAFLALAWLVLSWWPHDAAHLHTDVDDLTSLLFIEYAFHLTFSSPASCSHTSSSPS